MPGSGYGRPVKPVGLICSMFRPSDDATVFPFLVPSNFFAVVSLRQAAEMLETVHGDRETAASCRALAEEVEAALRQYAVVDRPPFGKIYAYEVDGYGNSYCVDDSNVPSLLSLPYFGAVQAADPIYQNTRRMLLSDANPYYFKGRAARRTGRSARRPGHDLAAGHHPPRGDQHGRRGNPSLPRYPATDARGHRFHARGVSQGRRPPVHPFLVRLGQHGLRRIDPARSSASGPTC